MDSKELIQKMYKYEEGLLKQRYESVKEKDVERIFDMMQDPTYIEILQEDMDLLIDLVRGPVYVDNEANLSAYYEYLNKKDSISNLIYVSITDGFGAGIIINGEIYRGGNNSSGEIGHTKISVNGKKCKCGNNGCLEAYTSINALLEQYNSKYSKNITDIEEFEELCDKIDEEALSIL